jgi:hypothetical protein
VLSASYIFGSDSLTLLPLVRELPETPVRIGLLLASLAAVVAPTVFTWRLTDAMSEARARMHLSRWQLQKLWPSDAKDAQGASNVRSVDDGAVFGRLA